MESVKNLVERLRQRHENLYGKDACPSCISEAADRIEALEKQRDELLAALEKLAKLGNGERYGNSEGNVIAQQAIASVKEKA